MARDGQSLLAAAPTSTPNRFEARPIRPADLAVRARPGPLRAVVARDGELLTDAALVEPRVDDGRVAPDVERDLLLLCNCNRCAERPPAVALARGFGLRTGALASSVARARTT